MEYQVTLSHNETIVVEAENESEALHKAYTMTDANCIWDEVEIEELEEE